ncbi:S-adenosylmethionine:tRNA ribosyltransferase-isomerase [Haladaptatus salinisoli]|uniref:S-adenosylmethionine:tRNA ribosyltransferase-isomerase n=1 Tax=Haladaptatus salinisoli TaxID=2884876 RepID=UPI001D0BAB52|nr:S-adenosylmethionine:tRNA ribosyltransferase-isomerase [Haladaptatus salinisoli]
MPASVAADVDLGFHRPADLAAAVPPEVRCFDCRRDDVDLLVSDGDDHRVAAFTDVAEFLDDGDLVVANDSDTLPASLPATGPPGAFVLNLATDYGDRVWLAEPRRSRADPGPIGLAPGDEVRVGAATARVVARHPAIDRFLFVRFDADPYDVMAAHGRPVRYGYVADEFPLDAYRTPIASVPGSSEMPSAGRALTARVRDRLADAGVGFATVTLHTGLSSLDADDVPDWRDAVTPEPVAVDPETARVVTETRARGGRVVAVGTTVVRALETATEPDGTTRPVDGFTRRVVSPETGARSVDALLTGLHDPGTTHLAMLYAVGGESTVRAAYDAAVRHRLRWHEFGDLHLLRADDGRR